MHSLVNNPGSSVPKVEEEADYAQSLVCAFPDP